MSEQQEPANDALAGAIEAFQRMSVPARPSDAAVLARLDAESRPAALVSTAKRSGYLWPFLVSSAAAVLLIAGMAVLLLNGAAAIALADVVKAAQKYKFVRYREQQIMDPKAHDVAPRNSTVYADFTAPRLYSESLVNGPEGESVLLSVHDGKHHLTSNSRQKTARLDFAPKGYKSLLCCLEEFQQKRGVTSERTDLDGRRAVKYCHVNGRQTITLWVDAQTKLPLRLDQESIDSDSSRSTLVWTDFAWDPDLPQPFRSWDELFSTRPPHGYTLDDRTSSGKQ